MFRVSPFGCAAFALILLSIALPISAQDNLETKPEGFIETFDDLGWRDRWFIANFDIEGSFATGWRRKLASVQLPSASILGEGALRLNLVPAPEDAEKPFFGAELQRSGAHHYGSYEVYMQPGRGDGLVSAFFTYTGPYFGNQHDEIDFEFLGRDTTRAWLNLFTDGDNLPGEWVDLGFDAANRPHLYRFEWRPDSVTWYVDDREILHVTSDRHPIPSTPGKLFLNIWAGNDKMVDWLKEPPADLTGEAIYHCVSYRPFGDDGRTCSDYIAETNG